MKPAASCTKVKYLLLSACLVSTPNFDCCGLQLNGGGSRGESVIEGGQATGEEVKAAKAAEQALGEELKGEPVKGESASGGVTDGVNGA